MARIFKLFVQFEPDDRELEYRYFFALTENGQRVHCRVIDGSMPKFVKGKLVFTENRPAQMPTKHDELHAELGSNRKGLYAKCWAFGIDVMDAQGMFDPKPAAAAEQVVSTPVQTESATAPTIEKPSEPTVMCEALVAAGVTSQS